MARCLSLEDWIMTITDTEVGRVADFTLPETTIFAPVMRTTPPFEIPALVKDEEPPMPKRAPANKVERKADPNIPPHVAARRVLAADVIDEGFANPYRG